MKKALYFLLFGFSAALIMACVKAESSTNKSETQTDLPIKKSKEEYMKTIVGTWRIDKDLMEAELNRFIDAGHDIVVQKEGESAELTQTMARGRQNVKQGVKDLDETLFEFHPDGRIISRAKKKELHGRFHFSRNLD